MLGTRRTEEAGRAHPQRRERKPRSLYRFFLDSDFPTCPDGHCGDRYDPDVFGDADDDEDDALATVDDFLYHTAHRT